MKTAFVANKPVRFDRDYFIGEVIPEAVIEPSMVRRLMNTGRILCTSLPEEGADAGTLPSTPQEGENNAAVGTEAEGEEKTQLEGGNPAVSEPDAAEGGTTQEYRCEVCGKTFTSKQELAAHSRTHEE